MGVDGRLADRKGKQEAVEKEEAVAKEETAAKEKSKSAKKNKRRQRKSPPMRTVVQSLFDTCKEVFADCGADDVPAPEDIERLRAILGVG